MWSKAAASRASSQILDMACCGTSPTECFRTGANRAGPPTQAADGGVRDEEAGFDWRVRSFSHQS